MADREPPREVFVGRRGLQDIEGVYEVGLPVWIADSWAIAFAVMLPAAAPSTVPANTAWFLVVDETYPRGAVQVLPAKVGGTTLTMPHQKRNGYGDPVLPWRTGKLCLERSLAVLGHHDEALSAGLRMAWHVRRTVEWLRAAASDELRGAAERFELPEMPETTTDVLGFVEDGATLDAWSANSRLHGFVELTKHQQWWRVERMDAMDEAPQWGAWLPQTPTRIRGGWIRAPRVPTVRNWSFPSTWGELRQGLAGCDVSLDQELSAIVSKLRSLTQAVLLLGAPVPKTWAGAPVEMHWWALMLPKLASPTKPPAGFRPTEKNLWRLDRQGCLGDDRKIAWMMTTNLARHRLRARGGSSARLMSRRILLIGAGALGSQVAELLVRLGADNLVLVDKETFDAGNAARHTLTLADVGRSKALAVADRLNQISPTAKVKGLNCAARAAPSSTDAGAFEVIVDCTADRDALDALESIGDGSRQIDWLSLSVSVDAARLYIFHARSIRFPRRLFDQAITPWVEKDWSEIDVDALTSEGAGCWHPLSPARADDVTAAAAIAVRVLDERIANGAGGPPQMIVFERREKDGNFYGFERVST
jgi:molybdopterin/thiamine biosynthesis adenylyltransferase